MNSREKGKRGERQWRDELRAHGYAARRGQQFSGSPESPDVVAPALPWIHFEVKAVQRLNIEDAMEQARRDCREKAQKVAKESTSPQPLSPSGEGERGQRVPIVAHRRSFRPWLVTMDAETFFRLLGGDFTEAHREDGEGNGTDARRGTDGTNSQAPTGDSESQT